MPEKSADSNRGGHQANHGHKLTEKRLTDTHRSTVDGADAHVARKSRQSWSSFATSPDTGARRRPRGG